MKWKKFVELRARYPFVESDVLQSSGYVSDIREFVRQKVGFIAFRPFEKLDLTTKPSWSDMPLKSEYAFVKMASYQAVEYSLIFHVEGEKPGSRLRDIHNDVGDGSIQAHIDHIMEWFNGCEVFNGKQLIWERVIRRTRSGSSHVGLTEVNLEIFLFPPNYRFRPI